MTVQIKISTVSARYVREALSRYELPIYEFMTWKSHFEFLLTEDPENFLVKVKAKEGWIHERTENKIVGGKNFVVTWEIEWDRANDQFILIEFRIVAMPPDLRARTAKPVQE